jgi:hypothetical protein
MATEPEKQPTLLGRISLDWWAVLTALAFALLILAGIISSVPW